MNRLAGFRIRLFMMEEREVDVALEMRREPRLEGRRFC